MPEPSNNPAAELAAIQSLYDTLQPMSVEAQARVLKYVAEWLGIADVLRPIPPAKQQTILQQADKGNGDVTDPVKLAKYATFAELFDSANPASNSDKVLVAGYWLQVCQNAESFDGQSANKELKNLGHGIANITNAVNGLKNQKPALALQLQKSGKSQQARKVYKVTVAGIKAVEAMIDG